MNARKARSHRARRGAPAVGLLFALLITSSCELAPINLKKERALPLRSTIVAADGTRLTRLFRENRSLVPFRSVPQHVIRSVLAAEDSRFYQHDGYDLKAIARAALANLSEGEVVQGGSTITQQYVKNVYFREPPRTLRRKAREVRIAIEVERLLSKDEILERYLNIVYFGDGAYGIKAGAETFFGHGLEHLTLSKSALLAAVIKSPSYYNPRAHPKRARVRRNYVIDRMAELGDIPHGQAARARRAPLGVIPEPPRVATLHPYFVEAVKREVLRQRPLGPSVDDRERELWNGGLRVETTLDPRLQQYAESAVASVLNQPGDPSAALVAIRPGSGEIVAMVGGRDWNASQVNLALGREGGGSGRQAGSAFKPFALAAALEAGIPLDARYESGPARFTFDDGSTWTVHNADGGDYGLLALDDALVHSVNGVYARLAMQIGGSQIATQAHLMGVASKLTGHPSLVLGTEEVSVLDMAAAYSTIATYGTAVQPTTIKQILLPTGEKILPEQEVVETALAPGNAYLMTKVMEEVMRSGTGTAAAIGRPAAGKTGTTDDYADAWFVGYTPQLVTAVWVGYPQGTVPMTSVHGIRVTGGTLPAAIWRIFMARAHEGLPVKFFLLPKRDMVTVMINPATGLLAAPWCHGKPQRTLRQLAPTEYCPQPVEPTPTPTPSPDKNGKGDDKGGKGQDDGDGNGKNEPGPKPSPSPKPSPEPTS